MGRATRDKGAPSCHDAFGINRLQATGIAKTGAAWTTMANYEPTRHTPVVIPSDRRHAGAAHPVRFDIADAERQVS